MTRRKAFFAELVSASSPEQFKEWLEAAEPGQSIVYATGDLSGVCECAKPDPVMRHLRAIAQIAFDDGLCDLVQRRVDVGVFDYIAIRRACGSARRYFSN